MSSNMRIKKVCQFCDSIFVARTTVTKYCGNNCSKKAYKLRRRNEEIENSNTITLESINLDTEKLKVKDFLSIVETSQLLGLSRRTVFRLIKRGQIKSKKFGRRTIIRRIDIEKLF